MRWTDEYMEFLRKSMAIASDREIAAMISEMTGEIVSERAVRIQRQRMGLLRGAARGRRGYTNKWRYDE